MFDENTAKYSSFEELANDANAHDGDVPYLTATVAPADRARFSPKVFLYAVGPESKRLREKVINNALAHPARPYWLKNNPEVVEYILHLIGMANNVTADANVVYFIGVVMAFNPPVDTDLPVAQKFMFALRKAMLAEDREKYCYNISVGRFDDRCHWLLSAMAHGMSLAETRITSVNGAMTVRLVNRRNDFLWPGASLCNCGVECCKRGIKDLDKRIEWREKYERKAAAKEAARQAAHEAHKKRQASGCYCASPGSPCSVCLGGEGQAADGDSETEVESPAKKAKRAVEAEV